MGRNILVVAFLVTSVIAITLFLAREDGSLRDQVDSRSKQPVITLEEYTMFRYDGHELRATLSGKLATFLEPNIVEMYGNVTGRKHGEEKEYASAESAAAYFASSGVTQFLKDNKIERAQLENDVKIGIGDNTLSTEFAEYIAAKDVLRSDRPVLMYGPTGRFKGGNGFAYSLTTEEMTVFGPLEGILQGAAANLEAP